MIDPVSLIAAALVHGALAGVSAVAEDAVQEGYRVLKSTIVARYATPGNPRLAEAIADLEREPGSSAAASAVEHELRASGVGSDPDLYGLANNLMSIARDPMRHLAATARVEQVQRTSALQAIYQIMDRHLRSVLAIRSRYAVDDTDLLTSSVAKTGLAPDARDEILRLHVDIRDIIQRVSSQMEARNSRDSEMQVRSMPLGNSDLERATRLIAADRQEWVSCRSLRTAVELLAGQNQIILDTIERGVTPDQEMNLALGNALIVYELTDFVIQYVAEFASSTTLDDIDQIHQEIQAKVDRLRWDDNQLRQCASDPEVAAPNREKTLENIAHRSEAIELLEKEWSAYRTELETTHQEAAAVRGTLTKNLTLMRDDARGQIGVLQLVAMHRFLKQNSQTIQWTIDALQGIQLVPLSSSRVRRLLGVVD